jgi:hypothetical protein
MDRVQKHYECLKNAKVQTEEYQESVSSTQTRNVYFAEYRLLTVCSKPITLFHRRGRDLTNTDKQKSASMFILIKVKTKQERLKDRI